VTASAEGEAAPEASGEVETRRAEPAVEAPPSIDAPDEAPVAAESEAEASKAPAETAPAPERREAAAPEEKPEAKPAPAPVRTQPDLPVITAADPTAPRRSGWWSRAKANLTGK
jgi:ribonuclease E